MREERRQREAGGRLLPRTAFRRGRRARLSLLEGSDFQPGESVSILYHTGLQSPKTIQLCAPPTAGSTKVRDDPGPETDDVDSGAVPETDNRTVNCETQIPSSMAGAFGPHTITIVGTTSGIKASTIFDLISPSLGQTGVDGLVCPDSYDWVQTSTGTASPSYTVPAGASTLTSWSVMGSTNSNYGASDERLEVWRRAGTFTYTLVGLSATESVQPNILNTFTLAPAIAVQPGDVLGLRTVQSSGPLTGSFCVRSASEVTDSVAFNGSDSNPVVGETETMFPETAPPGETFQLLNLFATLGP